MKQLKVVSLAACMLAAGFVSAGTLQVTPVQYAAETIVAGAALNATVYSYSLAAPIATTSAPVFTAEFKLNNALWNAALAVDEVALVDPTNTTGIRATSVVLNAAGDTMTATFTVAAGGTVPATGPVLATPPVGYTFPVGSNIIVGRTVAPVVKATAAQVAPALTCTASSVLTTLTAAIKNALGTETETVAPLNVLNNATYLTSNSALSVTAQASTGTAAETSKIDVTNPSLGKQFTNNADAGSTNADVNVVNIGSIVFSDRGVFKDATSVGGAQPYTVATGFGVAGAAAAGAGNVSVTAANVVVNGVFNTAGSVYLSDAPTCLTEVNLTTGAVAALATGTKASAAAQATLTGTSATLALAGGLATAFPASAAGRTGYICYKRDVTTTTAMAPSQFTIGAASSVTHAATESGPTPICGTNLYNLTQNGVRIDVRNFVGGATGAATGGWTSILRLINTDASQTATVTGQMIKNDGTVLAGATIATVPANGYTNLTSAQVEAALAGSASAGYTDAAGVNTRLRVSAPVSSLRVQNYLYNPVLKTFIEADGSQGDEQPGNAPTLVNEDARK